jgi:hypothetical protein
MLRTESGEQSRNIAGERSSELPMLSWKPTIRDTYTVTDLVPRTFSSQRGISEPPCAGFAVSSTVAQSLRPFPQFGTVSYLWAPLGRTWYDSMQIKAAKRFSHGPRRCHRQNDFRIRIYQHVGKHRRYLPISTTGRDSSTGPVLMP